MNELDLFAAAIAIADPDKRSSLLEQECAGRPDLRQRLEQLLAAHFQPNLLLDQSLPDLTNNYGIPGAATASMHNAKEVAGVVIAAKYSLVEPIGEGGMGSVWRAKQTEPVKRFVALKLIKAGMDSKQVLARFDAERQALALMDHPNIAKVLDGGLHEHRPYFVMELVKGVPITDYCDKFKLTPKERLELFVPVCQAIQHAHQKGIIHRDIKPSNVLIALYDDKPVVKVIDFGVAKATGASLTEATIDTGIGAVVGTPQYMSPEQATLNNLDIDTRSDIYALGVLLYELLTGSPPFAKKDLEKRGLLEMLRIVREDEPPRPSNKLSTANALPTLSANRGTEPKKLTGLLRNELDWIVMKALEKDRTRRYESANVFAADVQRYLCGEAVQAHPPSAAYLLQKFVRRNKAQVIAAGIVLATLMAGVVGTGLGLIRADQALQQEAEQRQIAEENEQLAKEAEGEAVRASERAKAAAVRTKLALDSADKMLGIQERFRPRGSDKYSPDQLATLQGLAAQFEAIAISGTGPDAAEAYNRLASVQILLDNLNERDKSLERSMQLWNDLVRTDPANANEYRVQVAKVRARQAAAIDYKTPPDPKHVFYLRQVMADWKAVIDADPTNVSAFSELSLVQHTLSHAITLHFEDPKMLPPAVVAERASLQREAVASLLKGIALRPDDRELHLRLHRIYGYFSGVSPANMRTDLQAALRFPDERIERIGFNPYRNLDSFERDEETWDTLLFNRMEYLIQRGNTGDVTDTTLSQGDRFHRGVVQPWRDQLKEMPPYKYAAGMELLLKIGEAKAAAWTSTPPGGEAPVPPSDSQQRRAKELFQEALVISRLPETKLPAAFLRFHLRDKGFDDLTAKRQNQSNAPLTAEEYVWFQRLGRTRESPDERMLTDLTRELTERTDWKPTTMFRLRLMHAILPDSIIYNEAISKEKLIACWLRAENLFTLLQAEMPREGDDYRQAAHKYSSATINCAGRFRDWGEREYAKRAMTRCIKLLEEMPPRPNEDDWRYRTRCYFDRGNLHLEGGEWLAALADFRSCLKLSQQKPGEYDSMSIPGMNAVAHFRSGVALLRLNQFVEAEKEFDEALKIRAAEKLQSRPLKSGKPSVPWLVPITEHDRANEYKLVGRWEPAENWAAQGLKTLAENEEAYPIEQVNHYRYVLHSIRAASLDGLKDHAAAAKAWDEARQFGTTAELREFAVISASAYTKAGCHEDAARRLDDLAKSDKLSNLELYNLACGYAHCSVGLKVSQEQAAKYQDQAMETLHKAVKAGWKAPEHAKQDPDFDPLRNRDDFKKLLAELEGTAAHQ